MVAPLIDPTAPGWAQRFALKLPQVFVSLFPKSPLRLASFDSSNLPDPADWAGALIYVTDKAKAGLSNGTAWTTTTGGAL